MYSVKILCDSSAPSGKRLTTWELTYPRFVHAELMTHRLFSRNSASSRAIPVEKFVERVKADPAMPIFWGKHQAGMQAYKELDENAKEEAERLWLEARDQALEFAEMLKNLGLHKQIVNRILEPWLFITVILSATEFDNFFHLRNHHAAQPEIAFIAKQMWHLYHAEQPREVPEGAWHLPFVTAEERLGCDTDTLKKISTGRCARVSYLTHDGRRDLQKDIELHDKLCAGPATGEPGHWSPFEHVARALAEPTKSGNFIGWHQYRKDFPAEHYSKALL